MNIDVVGTCHQIDGGKKNVAGEELLKVHKIGLGWNVIRANMRYDFFLRRHTLLSDKMPHAVGFANRVLLLYHPAWYHPCYLRGQ